jgi:outer membrane immunogenic protein
MEDDPVVYERDAFDWTGFYAGLNSGYGWMDADSVVGQIDPQGWVVGVHAGYNYNLDSLVLGVEGDIHWTGMQGSATSLLGTTATGKIDYFGTVRGRVGLDLDRLMPYVTAGLAYGQGTSTSTFGGGFTSSVFTTGWTAGAGVEHAMTDNVLLRGELLYVDYGDETFFTGTAIQETINVRFVTTRLGLSYKF